MVTRAQFKGPSVWQPGWHRQWRPWTDFGAAVLGSGAAAAGAAWGWGTQGGSRRPRRWGAQSPGDPRRPRGLGAGRGAGGQVTRRPPEGACLGGAEVGGAGAGARAAAAGLSRGGARRTYPSSARAPRRPGRSAPPRPRKEGRGRGGTGAGRPSPGAAAQQEPEARAVGTRPWSCGRG